MFSNKKSSRTPSSPPSAAKPETPRSQTFPLGGKRPRPSQPGQSTLERRNSRGSLRTGDKAGMARKSGSGSSSGQGRSSISDDTASPLGSRKLSFMECTLEQVEEAMRRENPNFDLHMDYWSVILTENPSDSFKILQNRTLSFWVKIFNKWIEIRKSADDDFVDGTFLQEMMYISNDNLKKICSVFDPEGCRRLTSTGVNVANLKRLKISATNLMVAGVMLSRVISSRHKLSFLFGLFDNDDSRTLDKQQFAAFVRGFMSALGPIFAIPDDWRPTDEEIKAVVDGLYMRIGQSASNKIRAIHACADEATQQAIIDFVRTRSLRSKDKATSKSIGTAQQAISYHALRDWCHGETSQSDPLALPYLLTIERFCPQRLGDVADEFDDELSEFQLSHSEPVPVPQDDTAVHSKELLSRAEVLFTRFTLDTCQRKRRWMFDISDLKSYSQAWGIDVSYDFKVSLSACLAQCLDERRRPEGGLFRFEFLDVMRKLCPKALPKHLRMFDVWCQEYDALLEERKTITNLEEADRTFAEIDKLPVLPQCELDALDRQFEDMDQQGRGYITLSDIMEVWGWSEQLARETVKAYDIQGDDYLDKNEFFKMMCPADYRLPNMCGLGTQVFGRLLKNEVENQKKSHNQQIKRFSNFEPTNDDELIIKRAPNSILPEVGEELWSQWVSIYDSLDKNADGSVNLMEMKESGILSWSVCESILKLIDPKDHHSFTREGFLQAMARTYDCRIPPEKLQAA